MGEEEAGEGCWSASCSSSLVVCVEGGGDGTKPPAVRHGGDAEQDEEYLDHLLSKETSYRHSPSSSSSSMASEEEWFRSARRDCVTWILETRGYFGFSPRTAYLAVAYLDRFCVHRRFDRSAMPWAPRLLAAACVSLAAKMEEYRAPAPSELVFRGEDDDYDGQGCCGPAVRRMELLVLSTLGWRLGDVTPFDYLACLSSRTGSGGAALVFAAAQAASVFEHRPSTVAVAAVLAAATTPGGAAMKEEALESTMGGLGFPSRLIDHPADVYACYASMLGQSESEGSPATGRANKRPPPPPPSSDSIGDATTTTYDDSDVASSGPARSRRQAITVTSGWSCRPAAIGL